MRRPTDGVVAREQGWVRFGTFLEKTGNHHSPGGETCIILLGTRTPLKVWLLSRVLYSRVVFVLLNSGRFERRRRRSITSEGKHLGASTAGGCRSVEFGVSYGEAFKGI